MRQKVRTLDIETSDGRKVILTVTQRGGLAIQTFRESAVSAKSLYQLVGSALVNAEFLHDWARTLYEATAHCTTPPARCSALVLASSANLCKRPQTATENGVYAGG